MIYIQPEEKTEKFKINMYLFKDKRSGIYHIVYTDYKGKKRWKSTRTKDKKLAQRLFNEFKRLYLLGKIKKLSDDLDRITVKEFFNEYLEYVYQTKEKKTYISYKSSLHKFLEFLEMNKKSNIYLKTINPKIIDDFIIHCKKLNLKPTSINVILRSLKASFNQAIKWNYLDKNPVLKMLPVEHHIPRYLTQEEIEKLFNECDHPEFKLFLYFALLTGMRRNEILNLKWEDINFQHNFIHIKKAKHHQSRIIPLHPILKEKIEEYIKDSGIKIKFKHEMKIFDWYETTPTHLFVKLCKKTGIKARLHDLRHSFATYALQISKDIRTVQKLLGHKDIKTTTIYADVLQEDLQKIVSNLKIVK